MTELEMAIELWAKRYARSFKDHGKPEGQSPEDWCNEILFEDVLEDTRTLDALASAAKIAFRFACKELDD